MTNARARAPGRAMLLLTALLSATPVHAAPSADESRVLAQLQSARALADLGRLSSRRWTVESGLGAGTVVSGSIEERALAQQLATRLRGLGLAVRLEPFPVRAYRYGPVQLSAGGEPLVAVSLHAAGGTWGTRDGVGYLRGNEAGGHRLRAPLIDAGEGYRADYDRLGDVRGHIVLVHRDLRDWPPAQISEAAHRGALAVLFYGHPGATDHPDALRQDSMWGHDRIAAVAVSQRTGEALRRRLGAGPVEVALENRADVEDGISLNVVATLRGSELPDEWVMVAAHYDRWFAGATDNVSGVASVLEIARAVRASGLRPRRSMLFVMMGSEEAGLEDPERDWLAGSHAFVVQHPEVMRAAALLFNIDLLGWTSPKATLVSTPDMAAAAATAIADLGYAGAVETRTTFGSVTDAWNFALLGGAATHHVERFTPDYFSIYHTPVDDYRPERFARLGDDLHLLTLSLWRAANAPRLPASLAALAASLDMDLAAMAAQWPDLPVGPTRAAAAALRDAAGAVEGRRGAAWDEATNRTLMSTRHSLLPWLYADDGEFSQAPRPAPQLARALAFGRTADALGQGDPAAAAAALAVIYEGRQCQRLSPAVYAAERGFWTGDGGWASRFQQRAAPPPSTLAEACVALAAPAGEAAALAGRFRALRADALEHAADDLALMRAELDQAAARLREFAALSTPPPRTVAPRAP
ncbi:MAG: M20/M25/M40 family metallo-hydrolase [Proteobacteria bacterium]|nr:M20/M25/M40 family metallo-hydrolase [Pseudomonadota bacterium]